MSSSPDHLYLDLSIINNDNTGSQPKTSLSFQESRTNPILHNPSNYFLSIARFEVDTPGVSLPIFIPLLNVDGVNCPDGYTNINGVTGQGGINQTAYTITMGNVIGSPPTNTLSGLFSLNVLWSPEDKTAPLPKNPQILDPSGNTIPNSAFTGQDITTGYYNCYSAKWWINCINNCLAAVYLGAGGGDTNGAPFLTIDPLTNLISLYTPPGFACQSISANDINVVSPAWVGQGSTPPVTYAMFFNEPLYNLLSSLNSVYYGTTFGNPAYYNTYITGATGQALASQRPYLFNYYIQPTTTPASPTFQSNIGTPPILFDITQSEYSPVPMWNPIQSIAFTSSLLPVVLSYDTLPVPYNTPAIQSNISYGNNSSITNMLSDIQVGLVSGTEYKPQVLYVPENEYRFVDLNGITPIHQASFSVSWKTKYNQVIPFRLGAQCGSNIKILFRRKRFNLANLPPYDTN